MSGVKRWWNKALFERASMLSGQYCSTLGQYGFGGLCDRRTPWLQGILKNKGYRTGAFGKFHVDCIGEDQWDFDLAAPDLPEDDDLARPHGWTYENYCREHGIPWMTDQIHGHLPFEHQRVGVRTGAKPSSAEDTMKPYVQRACRSDVPLEHSVESWETNCCLEGLREFAKTSDQPWFVWLTYHRPHCPTPLPEPWFSRIRPDEVVLEPLPSAEDLMTWPRNLFAAFRDGPSLVNLGENQFRFLVASYYTLIEFIDEQIGRVLAWLEQTGLDKTTTVLFTSDHGDDAGQRGCYDKYGIFGHSEGVTNVPLLIRPAACLRPAPPKTIPEPVELVDVAPTVLTLCGIDVPASMDGTNLASCLLDGESLQADRTVFCEEFRTRMVKHQNWRLYFNTVDDNDSTLYNLQTDPLAHRNLYRRTEPDIVDRRIDLKRQLLAHTMQRHHGPFTAADAARVKNGLDPENATLPVRLPGGGPNCFSFRAAAGITLNDHFLLVPYYEPKLYLFPKSEGAYQTSASALPSDPEIAEPMLDWGLRQAILRQMPISANCGLADWPEQGKESQTVSLQEAEAALAKPRS